MRNKITQEDRNKCAKAVEGDSENPLRVAAANSIYDGLEDEYVKKWLTRK